MVRNDQNIMIGKNVVARHVLTYDYSKHEVDTSFYISQK